MYNVDQIYVALVYAWTLVTEAKHILLGVTIAMTVAILKASRDKRPQNWGENLLCGVFERYLFLGSRVEGQHAI